PTFPYGPPASFTGVVGPYGPTPRSPGVRACAARLAWVPPNGRVRALLGAGGGRAIRHSFRLLGGLLGAWGIPAPGRKGRRGPGCFLSGRTTTRIDPSLVLGRTTQRSLSPVLSCRSQRAPFSGVVPHVGSPGRSRGAGGCGRRTR